MNKPAAWFREAWSKLPPLGYLTLAAFVICAVSGGMLALVYRPDAPIDSLALLLMKNPAGVLVRSVHYWSAQIFLISVFLHIVDYLVKRGEVNVAYGIWLRLALTVPVILYAMLSGFILRADPESQQAAQVTRTLLNLVPFVGGFMASALAGTDSSLFVVYLHHISTATIVIWLITIDHSHRILPGPRSLSWVLPPILVLSLLLVPGLGAYAAPVEKGPWYLVGLQEILHWLPEPVVAVWLALAALTVLALLPKFAPPLRKWIKQAMAVGLAVYVVCSVVGLYFRGAGWTFGMAAGAAAGEGGFHSVKSYAPLEASLVKTTVPMIGGKREGCLACHQEMTGFSPAHDPKVIGCTACHLGNPFTLNQNLAHAGMTLTPGNLSVVRLTCATANCHTDIEPRVRGSLMNSMSGVVAVDKCVFGESHDLNHAFDVSQLGHSPADTHLRNLCASCHLGQEKTLPAAIDEQTRGGGCSACHLNYDEKALAELPRRGEPGLSAVSLLHHPGISVGVSGQACFGCHSRSGRISTNYEGWHETLLDEAAAKRSPDWPKRYRLLADGRVFEKQVADVHFEKGMQCIDCHVASEIMGDGTQHAHQEEAIKISCLDCHTDKAPPVAAFSELDPETQKIAALRNLNEPGRKFVLAQSGRAAYPNVFEDAEGRIVLKRKTGAGDVLSPKPMATACQRNNPAHGQMECRTCHSAWVPQCISCHTSFDPAAKGWDNLTGKPSAGAWQEKPGDFLAEPPVLGVQQVTAADGTKQERVTTFAPGMIMSLDPTAGGMKQPGEFHRLYAPVSPHTTVTQSRDCLSCHANPVALGYGRGKLTYDVKAGRGDWKFEPAFAQSVQDGLPLDAWIAFLQEPKSNATTRNDARPFNLREQQAILLVGACLQCHNEKEARLAAVFMDFEHYRTKISQQCRLPSWVE